MDRQPEEFITVLEPPETAIGLGRRIARALRSAVYGGASIASGAFLAVIGLNALSAPSLPAPAPGCFGPYRPVRLSEAEVRAMLLKIQELIRETEIRARLPKAQPGVIVPRNLETYR